MTSKSTGDASLVLLVNVFGLLISLIGGNFSSRSPSEFLLRDVGMLIWIRHRLVLRQARTTLLSRLVIDTTPTTSQLGSAVRCVLLVPCLYPGAFSPRLHPTREQGAGATVHFSSHHHQNNHHIFMRLVTSQRLVVTHCKYHTVYIQHGEHAVTLIELPLLQ
jgi:hypothetical protein